MALDATGFTTKREDEIFDEIVAAVKASPYWGVAAQTGDGSRLGQLLRIFANREASVWVGLQQEHASFRGQTADGVHLDNLTIIGGIVREPAAPSVGEITPSGTPGTLITTGHRVRVPNGATFITTADGTIPNIIPIESIQTGAIEAAAGEITEIVDAVAGWTGVTNAADVSPGQDVETDAELRVRWLNSLAARGSSTDASIRARIEALEFVDACVVISNRTSSVDIYGTPEHAALVVVWPNTLTTAQENEILELLWSIWPAGILSWGVDVVGDVTDSRGFTQTMRFSYAIEVPIWVIVNVQDDPDLYPIDGDDQIEEAVLAYGVGLAVGDDVLPPPIIALIADVSGVRDVEVLLGTSNPPTVEDPVAISPVQIATFDAARITVNS